MSPIHITVNGRPQKLTDRTSLLGLLESLELDPRLVVVEHNRQIVRQPTLATTALADGDAVELVHFVGGG